VRNIRHGYDRHVPTLIVYGGLAGLAGLIVALFFATTVRRTLAVLGAGAAAALLAYGVADAQGAFETDPQCSNDCGLSALIAGALIVGNLIGWTAGVGLGALGRRLTHVPMRREQAG
jgi:zinc transporter ZupT